MCNERLLAVEMLAVADSLRDVCRRVDRLDRANHPAVRAGMEATILHANASAVWAALETLAARLGEQDAA